jgi:hypothetical protein
MPFKRNRRWTRLWPGCTSCRSYSNVFSADLDGVVGEGGRPLCDPATTDAWRNVDHLGSKIGSGQVSNTDAHDRIMVAFRGFMQTPELKLFIEKKVSWIFSFSSLK